MFPAGAAILPPMPSRQNELQRLLQLVKQNRRGPQAAPKPQRVQKLEALLARVKARKR